MVRFGQEGFLFSIFYIGTFFVAPNNESLIVSQIRNALETKIALLLLLYGREIKKGYSHAGGQSVLKLSWSKIQLKVRLGS